MSTNVQTRQPTAVELRQKEQLKNGWSMLEKMKPTIAAVLPKHLTPERMAMIAFTAMRKNPRLLECSPESIAGSIMTASMLGLEPSGPLGHGALIPYKVKGRYECQFQPMYQGLLDLARRSGFIKDVQLRPVYKGDTYKFRFGLDPTIEHEPMTGEGADAPDREVTNVYAIIRLTSGGVQWDQMSWAAAMAHGKRYSPSWDENAKQFKAGSVWADNPEAMALKTILKIVLKLCPKSTEMSAALLMDDLADGGKTSSMRKVDEGIFDLDLGERPEDDESAGETGNKAASALGDLVEKEKGKVQNGGPAAPASGPIQCDKSDFDQIELLGSDYQVFPRKWRKHIEEEMGFKGGWEFLSKERLPELRDWIMKTGTKRPD